MIVLKAKYNYYPDGDWELQAGEIYIGAEVADSYLIGDTFYSKDFFEVVPQVSKDNTDNI